MTGQLFRAALRAVRAIIVACFAAPLLWLIGQLLANPAALTEMTLDPFRLRLLARTVGYNLLVGAAATLLAVPAAVAMGRGRRGPAVLLTWLLPVSLLLPSIAFEYGWKQALRLADVAPAAQSVGDVARCVWTLAAWLWPIPAALGGMALRRTDSATLEQAVLDGVLGRITLRIIIRPLVVGGAIVFVLASQEFAVFEPSGISVVATEVRMVYETGAYSSAENPITQFFGAAGGGAGGESQSQSARAAAAVVTALPMTVCTGGLALLVWRGGRRLAVEDDLHVGPRPQCLRAPWWASLAAGAVLAFTTIVPLLAMAVSYDRRLDLTTIWATFAPQMTGSIFLATVTAAGVGAASVAFLDRHRRWVVALALACFLVGGQMLAIGLIRIFNRDATAWVYDSWLIAVVAYVSRFGWLALAAAGMTWARPWRSVRDLAAVDGATGLQTVFRVVLPLAWPMLTGAAILVGVLSLTEVPATLLLGPQRPQPITPMLMGWVHLQRYDAMIEGTLLLCGVVLAASVVVVALFVASTRVVNRLRRMA